MGEMLSWLTYGKEGADQAERLARVARALTTTYGIPPIDAIYPTGPDIPLSYQAWVAASFAEMRVGPYCLLAGLESYYPDEQVPTQLDHVAWAWHFEAPRLVPITERPPIPGHSEEFDPANPDHVAGKMGVRDKWCSQCAAFSATQLSAGYSVKEYVGGGWQRHQHFSCVKLPSTRTVVRQGRELGRIARAT